VLNRRAKAPPGFDCPGGRTRIGERSRGHDPILLLDEIAAHLDAKRRSALFEEVVSLGAQAWMTGTDDQLFWSFGDKADTFIVNEGRFLKKE